jgi:hypothetical protein
MKPIKISTNNFEVFDKFSKLDLLGNIKFEDTPINRERVKNILNNINNKNNLVELSTSNDKLYIKKLKDLKLNVYFKFP